MRFLARTVVALPAIIAAPALAEDRSIEGTYVCESGCRVTDAYPSIAIDGDKAICMNEFGGVFDGRVVSRTSVSCFNKLGALSDDGQTIRWGDGGVVWRRAPAR
jgi:hypothetical protein